MSVKKWILAHLLQFDRQLSRAGRACSSKTIPFYARSMRRAVQKKATVSAQDVLNSLILTLFCCPGVVCLHCVDFIRNACLFPPPPSMRLWAFICNLSMSLLLFILSDLLSVCVYVDQS